MKTLQIIALTLTIIGAINWGLFGLFDYDLVAGVFGGSDTAMSTIIYTIIAIAGLINLKLLFTLFDDLDKK